MRVGAMFGRDVLDPLVDLPEQVLVRRQLFLLPIIHTPESSAFG
jgi:hypothetical protein